MPSRLPSSAALLRPLPALAPEDSLYRALALLRAAGAAELPVLSRRGELVGVIGLDDLRSLAAAAAQEGDLTAPVAGRMRRAEAVAHAGAPVEQIRLTMSEGGFTQLYVVDAWRRYLGAITLVDLLAPEAPAPRPPSVGGMATPWGVYLTTGTLQAGAGLWSLVSGGALMGLLLVVAHTGVGLLSWLAQQSGVGPLFALWNAPQPPATLGNAGWYLLQGAALPLFLALVRATPLTAYHAAEHQVVHTVERGEPLCLDVAARMPRVHQRCGTNLMAAAVLFLGVSQLLPVLSIGLGAAESTLIGAVAALFTWRSLGAFLQQHFTTRRPTSRQLECGLRAAEELLRKYLSEPPRRPTLVRRLWCSGALQSAIGIAVGLTASAWAARELMRALGA